MRRTIETAVIDSEGAPPATDADAVDVEGATLLLSPSASAAGPQARVVRWLPVALVMLLLMSAASIFLYDIQGLSDSLREDSRDGSALQTAVKITVNLERHEPPRLASSVSGGSGANDTVVRTSKRLAYMFYVTSDIYGCAALHLMDNLVNRVKMDSSRIELVVLHSDVVSQKTLDRIRAVVPVRFIQVETIRADVSGATWLESLTKLNAFRDWGYDRVVYMDADAVPMQNLDHLFDLAPAPLYAPTAYWLPQPFFASTLMVIQPSDTEFDAIIGWARQQGAAAGYDMDILNKYFAKSVQYLPGDYTVLNSDFRAKPEAKNKLYKTTTELKRHVKLIHFSCKPDGSYGKPWTAGSHSLGEVKQQGFDPLFAELFEAYWKTEEDKC